VPAARPEGSQVVRIGASLTPDKRRKSTLVFLPPRNASFYSLLPPSANASSPTRGGAPRNSTLLSLRVQPLLCFRNNRSSTADFGGNFRQACYWLSGAKAQRTRAFTRLHKFLPL